MNVRARRSGSWNALVGLSLAALAGVVSAASHALDVSARRAIAADLPAPSVITGECTNDPDCDDTNDCTVDQCIDNTCVYTDEPDDTPCPDGLFCNGDETCQTGVCTDQVDPCVDQPHCDENNDVCFECVDNAECDDANDCTLDECIANACVNTPVPGRHAVPGRTLL